MAQTDNIQLTGACEFVFKATLAPVATGANNAVEQAFTLNTSAPKLVSTDLINVYWAGVGGSGNAVTIGACRVNASGQLVIQFVNPTAGSLTAPTGLYEVFVFRLPPGTPSF